MNKQIYCPDRSFRGFECTWWIAGRTLYVESCGANSFRDWMDCIFGAFSIKKYHKDMYHRKWFYMAFRFYRFIRNYDFDRIEMAGHSMGGVVNSCLSALFVWHAGCYKVISSRMFGSPKACYDNGIFSFEKSFYNRGDFIPFLPPWYEKIERIMLNRKWRPIWKSHSDYNWRF